MVYDEIWLTVAKKDELLCINCLESRLGRKLVQADFIDAPINKMNYYVVGLHLSMDMYSIQLFKSGVRLKNKKIKQIVEQNLPREQILEQFKTLGI